MKFFNLTLNFCENVYEPDEDSFLLAEYVMYKKGKILDMGSGTGIVGLLNAKNNPENIVYCVDISDNAINCIKHNINLNNINNVKVIKSNLFEKLTSLSFDYIFFNPPYLPGNKYLDLDGGKYGDELILNFLSELKNYLILGGACYLILSSHTRWDRILYFLRHNFSFKIIKRKSYFFESLFLLEIIKNYNTI